MGIYVSFHTPARGATGAYKIDPHTLPITPPCFIPASAWNTEPQAVVAHGTTSIPLLPTELPEKFRDKILKSLGIFPQVV